MNMRGRAAFYGRRQVPMVYSVSVESRRKKVGQSRCPLPLVVGAWCRARGCALVVADLGAAAQLHADDFQLITPGGGTLPKEEYLSRVASGAIDYQLWEPDSPIAVRLYGDGAAIRYRAQAEVGGTKGIHTWHTDVYERREGRWHVVWF